MNLEIQCPHCGEHLSIAGQYAGQPGACKKCGGKFTVPLPQAAMQAPPTAKLVAQSASGPPWLLITGGLAVVVAIAIGAFVFISDSEEPNLAPPIASATPAQVPQLAPSQHVYAGGKTLNFPADLSVGHLMWRDWGNREFTSYQAIGPAQGTVSIPEGKEIMIIVGNSHPNDLSFLRTLKPGDVQILRLQNKPFTDDDLEHFRHLNDLVWLDVMETSITSAGLDVLQNLSSLEGLWIANNNIDDTALPHLEGLTRLAMLGINGTRISAQGALTIIEANPSLSFLAISAHQASDQLIPVLQKLAPLTNLNIKSAEPDTIEQYQAALPNVTVGT